MLRNRIVAALAGIALAVPAAAEAGDGPFSGARRGGGAPPRAAPRPAPSRTPAPRSAPRVQAPRAQAPRAQAPRVAAPRRDAPRIEAPRREPARLRLPRSATARAAFGDDGLPRDGGRRLAPPPRRADPPAAGADDAPRSRLRDAFRGHDVPRGGQPAAGSGARARAGGDDRAAAGDRRIGLREPGFAPGPRAGRDRTGAGVGPGASDGFLRGRRPEPGAAPSRSGGIGHRADGPDRRVDWTAYREGFRNGYRTAHSGYGHGHHGHFGYHDWYDRHHWYLSFSFGVSCGPYFGVSYYWPYRSWVYGCDYAFFYPSRVAYCYVPFGFYWDYSPLYVTRHVVVRETVPVTVYETRVVVEETEAAGGAAGPASPPEEGEARVADPRPAAGSPATEKFLREASDHFRKKEYYDAAVKFRLAALSSPDLAGPLFALGQSLTALGQDAYAARVIRRAVLMDPLLLQETGDISGVYESPAEYEAVLAVLEARAADAPVDGDARFLLAAQRYFAGDARCREEFDRIHVARPDDQAVNLFRAAVDSRFKGPSDVLPPVEAPK